ncbi:hypothetical protein JM654_19800 [Microbacterium oxydans]|nr:hypothetical protein [Microbacterium oxydans]
MLAKQMPAMGGLPAETIRYSYDSWGKLSGVRGTSIILANTVYSPIGQLSQFNRVNGSTSTAYSTYGYDAATGAVLSIKDNAVFGDLGALCGRSGIYPRRGRQCDLGDDELRAADGGDAEGLLFVRFVAPADVGLDSERIDGVRGHAVGERDGWASSRIGMSTRTTTPPETARGLVKRSSMGTATTATYTYAAAGGDRPHAVNAVTGPAGVGPGSYSYDAAGNMTGRPGQTITFNDAGKVSKVVAGSTTQETVYNVDGSILLRTNTTEGSTLFVGDTVLKQATGSTVIAGIRTYSGAEGKPIAEKSAKTVTAGTTLTWLFSNLEGTVDVQTVANATGTTTRMLRDPYGAPIGSSGVWGSGTGYMNKPVTASTGLTTVGARTYDPVLGSFCPWTL